MSYAFLLIYFFSYLFILFVILFECYFFLQLKKKLYYSIDSYIDEVNVVVKDDFFLG